VRYLPTGALDTTFGTGGIVQDFSACGPNVSTPALQPDGDILVTLTASLTASGTDFGVARFNGDGTRDTTFGTGCLTSVNLSAAALPSDFGTAIALQPDGKIVVAGYYAGTVGNDVAIVRELVVDALLPLSAGIFCDGTISLTPTDPARIPPDSTVGKCEVGFGKQAAKLLGAYVKCLAKEAVTGLGDTPCEAMACTKYDGVAGALAGSTCAGANAYGIGNQLERLVDRDLNPLLYCAGSLPFP
jgi:uncharacterized delta-60 repeat protein